MALGDFIHEQASSKIQDMRDRKHAEEDREYERQAQLEDEFRGKQQAVAGPTSARRRPSFISD